MKTFPSIFFYIFCILFLTFIWAFTDYWNGNINDYLVISANRMDKSTFVFAIYGLFLLLFWTINTQAKFQGIHLVCILWILIMPIIMHFNKERLYNYAYTILWPVIFEVTYLLYGHFEGRVKALRYVFIIIAVYGVYLFFQTRNMIAMQTNTIYFSLLTLPWLLYGQDKRVKNILMVVFTLLAMLSLKRSAMLSMAFSWFFYTMEMIKNRKNLFYSFIIIGVISIGVMQLYNRINYQLEGVLSERVNREEVDEGRNRLAIWNLTMAMIQSSPTDKLIKGHGHYGVKKNSMLEISAHNDFLEVLYDYGIIIFVLYLCLWGHVLRRCYYLYKMRSSLFLPYSVSLSIFMIMSMVSHLILYASYFIYLVMFWAMVEAKMRTFANNKRNIY